MPKQPGAAPAPEQHQPTERRVESSNLIVRYGKIGIPAVAAALRYSGTAKNPAYAPVVPRINLRLMEMAA